MTSLSVLVPVFNEQHLVAASLSRLQVLEASHHLDRIQVIVVDDSSSDATPDVLRTFAFDRNIALAPAVPATRRTKTPPLGIERGRGSCGKIEWIFLRHSSNAGKGAAIRSAIAHADCELSIIHDADLEYHPTDILRIVEVFVEEEADAVIGSRFSGSESRRVLMFRHELGNRLLTLLTNLVTNLNLTDMETCYKAVRTKLLKSIPLTSDDFRLEPELIIKLAKREARIFEVPIRYSGRDYQEGKKIRWRDGARAFWAILQFAVSDRVYTADEAGAETLGRLARAPLFNQWIADVIRPYCGESVLEIGSGIGNLTRRLIPRRRYVASDTNPLYVDALRSMQNCRPYLGTALTDVTKRESFPPEAFDTVVCLNVIEHVEDDCAALNNIRCALQPNGRAVVLVPCGPSLFGTLDEVLGHKRRYTEDSLRELGQRAGLHVAKVVPFNRVGSFAWWLNGRVLERRSFGIGQIITLNLLTPMFRLVDHHLPLPPLSLIALMEPAETSHADSSTV